MLQWEGHGHRLGIWRRVYDGAYFLFDFFLFRMIFFFSGKSTFDEMEQIFFENEILKKGNEKWRNRIELNRR